MQQKIAQKEKATKEEHLRMLAQRAREERGGLIAPSTSNVPSAARTAAMANTLAAYGSGSESGSDGEEESEEDEDEESKKIRDEMRREKRQQREREMRMNNMGTEQRAKQLARYVLPILSFMPHSLTLIYQTTKP